MRAERHTWIAAAILLVAAQTAVRFWTDRALGLGHAIRYRERSPRIPEILGDVVGAVRDLVPVSAWAPAARGLQWRLL